LILFIEKNEECVLHLLHEQILACEYFSGCSLTDSSKVFTKSLKVDYIADYKVAPLDNKSFFSLMVDSFKSASDKLLFIEYFAVCGTNSDGCKKN